MQSGAFTEQHKQKGQVLSALKAGSEDEGVLGWLGRDYLLTTMLSIRYRGRQIFVRNLVSRTQASQGREQKL